MLMKEILVGLIKFGKNLLVMKDIPLLKVAKTHNPVLFLLKDLPITPLLLLKTLLEMV